MHAKGEDPRKNRNSVQMGLIQKQNKTTLGFAFPRFDLGLSLVLASFLGRLFFCGTDRSSPRLTSLANSEE